MVWCKEYYNKQNILNIHIILLNMEKTKKQTNKRQQQKQELNKKNKEKVSKNIYNIFIYI